MRRFVSRRRTVNSEHFPLPVLHVRARSCHSGRQPDPALSVGNQPGLVPCSPVPSTGCTPEAQAPRRPEVRTSASRPAGTINRQTISSLSCTTLSRRHPALCRSLLNRSLRRQSALCRSAMRCSRLHHPRLRRSLKEPCSVSALTPPRSLRSFTPAQAYCVMTSVTFW